MPPYSRTTWSNGTPIDPPRMNNIEDELVLLDGRPVTPTVVNGKWLKGVGGVPVWSDITSADITDKGSAGGVATLGSTGQVTAGQRATVSATPPGSPIDGDEWILPVDTTNGVMWRFRYRAASGSTYKWEFIGGSPLNSDVGASVNSTSTTYADLAGSTGPTVTVPRGGDYDVMWGVYMYNSTVGIGNLASPSWAGAVLLDSDAIIGQGQTPVSASRLIRRTGMTASDVIKIQYRVGGGTGTFANRWLRVTPYRVS
jgi:hypothetical protein